ncbi:cyclic lactone autoinducer peptide [Brevibacterium sp. JNUCC-42]|nr:cyclic lactone autoinducer peptide [Brevibacterium sp. JNUCC-42]
MKKQIAILASSCLTLVANVFVSSASAWFVHNPEVPKELLNK